MPSGTIQKPRIGKKPRKPQSTNSTPIAIRAGAQSGSVNEREPILIVRAKG